MTTSAYNGSLRDILAALVCRGGSNSKEWANGKKLVEIYDNLTVSVDNVHVATNFTDNLLVGKFRPVGETDEARKTEFARVLRVVTDLLVAYTKNEPKKRRTHLSTPTGRSWTVEKPTVCSVRSAAAATAALVDPPKKGPIVTQVVYVFKLFGELVETFGKFAANVVLFNEDGNVVCEDRKGEFKRLTAEVEARLAARFVVKDENEGKDNIQPGTLFFPKSQENWGRKLFFNSVVLAEGEVAPPEPVATKEKEDSWQIVVVYRPGRGYTTTMQMVIVNADGQLVPRFWTKKMMAVATAYKDLLEKSFEENDAWHCYTDETTGKTVSQPFMYTKTADSKMFDAIRTAAKTRGIDGPLHVDLTKRYIKPASMVDDVPEETPSKQKPVVDEDGWTTVPGDFEEKNVVKQPDFVATTTFSHLGGDAAHDVSTQSTLVEPVAAPAAELSKVCAGCSKTFEYRDGNQEQRFCDRACGKMSRNAKRTTAAAPAAASTAAPPKNWADSNEDAPLPQLPTSAPARAPPLVGAATKAAAPTVEAGKAAAASVAATESVDYVARYAKMKRAQIAAEDPSDMTLEQANARADALKAFDEAVKAK